LKLCRMVLAILISLVLVCSFSYSIQADDEAGVGLSATVALTISDVSASSIGYHSATISWKTNGDATSQVFYDTESRASPGDYANSTTEETTRVTEHSTSLTGLSSSTTYHYRVRSAIPDTKFIAISEDYTFKTLTPAVGGGGFGPALYYIDTNLFGIEAKYRISYSGELLKIIEATSQDGMLTIAIPEGTIALDKDGKRLEELRVAVNESPPPPPEDACIIGLAYSFEPKGATFDPAIPLTWKYPEALPDRVDEENLVLAYYDEDNSQWIELDCTVDTENNTITASVSHLTTFAVIGTITPLPPPAPAAFSVGSLSISPAEVNVGETVTISAIVANTGGETGSYEVTLEINGAIEATKEITVSAGASEEVTFTTLKGIAGTYSVDVNGLIGSFTVKEKPVPVVPKPVNWPLVGGIIAGVVVIVLAIFFWIRRRAT